MTRKPAESSSQIVTMAQIKAALRLRGKSVRGWAIERGYLPCTVYQVIHRWAHRPSDIPHGGIARLIMADLRRDTASEPSRKAA